MFFFCLLLLLPKEIGGRLRGGDRRSRDVGQRGVWLLFHCVCVEAAKKLARVNPAFVFFLSLSVSSVFLTVVNTQKAVKREERLMAHLLSRDFLFLCFSCWSRVIHECTTDGSNS